jgi:diguanylate cyclase (GGDEF)-like protein
MSRLELNAIEAFLERKRLDEGQILFHEGDPGSELFIVREGLMGSYVNQNDGTRREVYDFKPGGQFGEMAIIETAPRSATCYAKKASDLFVLEAIDFYRLVWEHPVIGVKILTSMIGTMKSWLDEASGFLGDTVRLGETARKRSITDDLSGLFNRRFLEETVRFRFSRGSAEARRSSLVMLDIDRFRDINAEFGSQAGDSVIAKVGAAFAKVVADPGLAARLSGDEFAVFLPGTRIDEAAEVAEALRVAAAGLAIEFCPGPAAAPRRIAVTVSLGVAEGDRDFEALSAAADRALYRSKEGGRNRVTRSAD